MRIVLVESGGFVGVPLEYEVDVCALGAADVSALKSAMVTAPAEPHPAPNSAGGLCIRMEDDDGSENELTLSNAAPGPATEIAALVDRVRACAKLVPKQ